MDNKDNLNNLEVQGLKATQNVRGFMHWLNEIGQAFIDFSSKAPGLVVDMGVAYGVATIPILQKHIEVIACDMEQTHLDDLPKNINPELLPYYKPLLGYFPNDYKFEKNSVGAILLSHILHFLSPEEMDIAIQKLLSWLAPNGKVFIVAYSPYVANMKKFIPIYKKRVSEKVKWPYWVENNLEEYFDGLETVKKNLPSTVNYLDLPPLIKALQSVGFSLEKAEYLDPDKNNIPDGVRLDNREWIGVIAVKPE